MAGEDKLSKEAQQVYAQLKDREFESVAAQVYATVSAYCAQLGITDQERVDTIARVAIATATAESGLVSQPARTPGDYSYGIFQLFTEDPDDPTRRGKGYGWTPEELLADNLLNTLIAAQYIVPAADTSLVITGGDVETAVQAVVAEQAPADPAALAANIMTAYGQPIGTTQAGEGGEEPPPEDGTDADLLADIAAWMASQTPLDAEATRAMENWNRLHPDNKVTQALVRAAREENPDLSTMEAIATFMATLVPKPEEVEGITLSPAENAERLEHGLSADEAKAAKFQGKSFEDYAARKNLRELNEALVGDFITDEEFIFGLVYNTTPNELRGFRLQGIPLDETLGGALAAGLSPANVLLADALGIPLEDAAWAVQQGATSADFREAATRGVPLTQVMLEKGMPDVAGQAEEEFAKAWAEMEEGIRPQVRAMPEFQRFMAEQEARYREEYVEGRATELARVGVDEAAERMGLIPAAETPEGVPVAAPGRETITYNPETGQFEAVFPEPAAEEAPELAPTIPTRDELILEARGAATIPLHRPLEGRLRGRRGAPLDLLFGTGGAYVPGGYRRFPGEQPLPRQGTVGMGLTPLGEEVFRVEFQRAIEEKEARATEREELGRQYGRAFAGGGLPELQGADVTFSAAAEGTLADTSGRKRKKRTVAPELGTVGV